MLYDYDPFLGASEHAFVFCTILPVSHDPSGVSRSFRCLTILPVSHDPSGVSQSLWCLTILVVSHNLVSWGLWWPKVSSMVSQWCYVRSMSLNTWPQNYHKPHQYRFPDPFINVPPRGSGKNSVRSEHKNNHTINSTCTIRMHENRYKLRAEVWRLFACY